MTIFSNPFLYIGTFITSSVMPMELELSIPSQQKANKKFEQNKNLENLIEAQIIQQQFCPLYAEQKLAWADLSLEVKFHILSFLSEPKHLFSFSCTNRECETLTEEACKKIMGKDMPFFPESPTPYKTTYFFRETTYKFLKNYINLPNKDIPPLLKRIKNFNDFCQKKALLHEKLKNLPHAMLLASLEESYSGSYFYKWIAPWFGINWSQSFARKLKRGIRERDVATLELAFLLCSLPMTTNGLQQDKKPHIYQPNVERIRFLIRALIEKNAAYLLHRLIKDYPDKLFNAELQSRNHNKSRPISQM